MKQKLVSVDSAALQTVTVEIKTLVIGQRQMTLAVFRQLPTHPAFDLEHEQVPFAGVPWGRVNYHWTGCDDVYVGDEIAPLDHEHIILQRGSVLYRATVHYNLPQFYLNEDKRDLHEFKMRCLDIQHIGAALTVLRVPELRHGLRRMFAAGQLPAQIGTWILPRDPSHPSETASADIMLRNLVENRPSGLATLQQLFERARFHVDAEDLRRFALQSDPDRITLAPVDISSVPSDDGVRAVLKEAEEAHDDLKSFMTNQAAAYQQRIKDVAALDQLFIAV